MIEAPTLFQPLPTWNPFTALAGLLLMADNNRGKTTKRRNKVIKKQAEKKKIEVVQKSGHITLRPQES